MQNLEAFITKQKNYIYKISVEKLPVLYDMQNQIKTLSLITHKQKIVDGSKNSPNYIVN